MNKNEVNTTKKEFFEILVKLSKYDIRLVKIVHEIDGLMYGFIKLNYGEKDGKIIWHRGQIILQDMFIKNDTKFWRKDYNTVDNSEKLERELMKYKGWLSEFNDLKK